MDNVAMKPNQSRQMIKKWVKFQVPTKYVGRLIGKHGNNIKSLMEETNTFMRILDISEKENNICEIFGPTNCVEAARIKVLQQVAQFSSENVEIEISFGIPCKYVGRVIGTGGKHINPIRTKTCTRISFLDVPKDKETKICKIIGHTAMSVNSAKYEISMQVSKLNAEEEKRDALAQGRIGTIEFLRCSIQNVEDIGKQSQKRTKLCPHCDRVYSGKIRRHLAESKICKSLSKNQRLREDLQNGVNNYFLKTSLLDKQKQKSFLKTRPKSPTLADDVRRVQNAKRKRTSKIEKPLPLQKLADDFKRIQKTVKFERAVNIRESELIQLDSNRVFYCTHKFCKTSEPFFALQKLTGHYKKDHPSQFSSKVNVESQRPIQLTCEMCSRNFKNRRAFAMHQQGSNTSNCQMSFSLDIPVQKKTHPGRMQLIAKPRPEYECSFCCVGLDMLSPSSYRGHLEAVHEKFWCDLCNAVFNSRIILMNHRRFLHNNKEVRSNKFNYPACKSCHVTFTSYAKFHQHIRNKRLECSRSACTCVTCSSEVMPRTHLFRESTTVSSTSKPAFVKTQTIGVMRINHELLIGDPAKVCRMASMSRLRFKPLSSNF